MATPLVQVTQQKTAISATPDQIAEARARFDREKYLKLPGFVHPQLLALFLEELERTNFEVRVHEGIGVEQCAVAGLVSGTMEMLLNDPALFDTIRAITDCGHIGCFSGRVYRLVPNSEHYDSWHSDVGQDRLIAVSINVGRVPYEGGKLQIRLANSEDILSEVYNPVAGDAVIFRVDESLRHRVDTVTGTIPRTAYAGWFRSQPEYSARLLDRLGH